MKNPLVEEFCLEYAEKLDIPIEKMREAILFSFKYFRKEMSKEDLPEIRLQYFGVFRPLKGRLTRAIANIKMRRNLNKISSSEYERLITMLEKRLEDYD